MKTRTITTDEKIKELQRIRDLAAKQLAGGFTTESDAMQSLSLIIELTVLLISAEGNEGAMG